MGLLARLAALILGGNGEACPHCGRPAAVITRDEPDPDQPETWPVLVVPPSRHRRRDPPLTTQNGPLTRLVSG